MNEIEQYINYIKTHYIDGLDYVNLEIKNDINLFLKKIAYASIFRDLIEQLKILSKNCYKSYQIINLQYIIKDVNKLIKMISNQNRMRMNQIKESQILEYHHYKTLWSGY